MSVTTGALIDVAEGWSHRDDYNVPTVSLDTLRRLARYLAVGDDRDALKAHGDHTLTDCRREDCAALIPAAIADDPGLASMLGLTRWARSPYRCLEHGLPTRYEDGRCTVTEGNT